MWMAQFGAVVAEGDSDELGSCHWWRVLRAGESDHRMLWSALVKRPF